MAIAQAYFWKQQVVYMIKTADKPKIELCDRFQSHLKHESPNI